MVCQLPGSAGQPRLQGRSGSARRYRPAAGRLRSTRPRRRAAPPAHATEGGRRDQEPRKQMLLTFAHCLRGHGVTGFPDPNADGQLTLEMISAAGVDIHTRSFVDGGEGVRGCDPWCDHGGPAGDGDQRPPLTAAISRVRARAWSQVRATPRRLAPTARSWSVRRADRSDRPRTARARPVAVGANRLAIRGT